MKMFALALAAALVIPAFAFAQHDAHGSAPAQGHDAAKPAGHEDSADKTDKTHETTTTKETTTQKDKMKSNKKKH